MAWYLASRSNRMVDSGFVGSTDFHSAHPQGRGTTRAEDAPGTPTQSHKSPSTLVSENEG